MFKVNTHLFGFKRKKREREREEGNGKRTKHSNTRAKGQPASQPATEPRSFGTNVCETAEFLVYSIADIFLFARDASRVMSAESFRARSPYRCGVPIRYTIPRRHDDGHRFTKYRAPHCAELAVKV